MFAPVSTTPSVYALPNKGDQPGTSFEFSSDSRHGVLQPGQKELLDQEGRDSHDADDMSLIRRGRRTDFRDVLSRPTVPHFRADRRKPGHFPRSITVKQEKWAQELAGDPNLELTQVPMPMTYNLAGQPMNSAMANSRMAPHTFGPHSRMIIGHNFHHVDPVMNHEQGLINTKQNFNPGLPISTGALQHTQSASLVPSNRLDFAHPSHGISQPFGSQSQNPVQTIVVNNPSVEIAAPVPSRKKSFIDPVAFRQMMRQYDAPHVQQQNGSMNYRPSRYEAQPNYRVASTIGEFFRSSSAGGGINTFEHQQHPTSYGRASAGQVRRGINMRHAPSNTNNNNDMALQGHNSRSMRSIIPSIAGQMRMSSSFAPGTAPFVPSDFVGMRPPSTAPFHPPRPSSSMPYDTAPGSPYPHFDALQASSSVLNDQAPGFGFPPVDQQQAPSNLAYNSAPMSSTFPFNPPQAPSNLVHNPASISSGPSFNQPQGSGYLASSPAPISSGPPFHQASALSSMANSPAPTSSASPFDPPQTSSDMAHDHAHIIPAPAFNSARGQAFLSNLRQQRSRPINQDRMLDDGYAARPSSAAMLAAPNSTMYGGRPASAGRVGDDGGRPHFTERDIASQGNSRRPTPIGSTRQPRWFELSGSSSPGVTLPSNGPGVIGDGRYASSERSSIVENN